jgi:methylenetetrahydrofolate dehydrogenase (NADP+)/methenyltetrahydrofolate cyclohydrolase
MSTPHSAQIIDGVKQANALYKSLANEIAQLKQKSIIPKLCVILVGDDDASHIYVNRKISKAKEIGIEIEAHFLDKNISQKMLLDIVNTANLDSFINGILVQLPLPEHLNQHEVVNAIDHRKDVDGFTVHNIGLLNSWMDCLEPSTPQGALMLIKSVLGDDLSGKKAVVLGRSLIVGRPMTSMLIRESATVTLLHSRSVNIDIECKEADIIVSAVGQTHIIKASHVKSGACVIDVGINRINGKVVGDVDFEEVKNVAGFITPVPGGVGPMTVACMLSNTVKACKNQRSI